MKALNYKKILELSIAKFKPRRQIKSLADCLVRKFRPMGENPRKEKPFCVCVYACNLVLIGLFAESDVLPVSVLMRSQQSPMADKMFLHGAMLRSVSYPI